MRAPVSRGRKWLQWCALAACLALGACATSRDAADKDSLYRALGQDAGIARLVDALVERCYTDPRISALFQDTERADLNRLIREQFCVESGGPCTYSGRTMQEAHGGLDLKHAEFDAFVEDLILAMEDVDLPYRTQNRMLRIFAPMRPDIVDQ